MENQTKPTEQQASEIIRQLSVNIDIVNTEMQRMKDTIQEIHNGAAIFLDAEGMLDHMQIYPQFEIFETKQYVFEPKYFTSFTEFIEVNQIAKILGISMIISCY